MLGAGHSHAQRVRTLLEAARDAVDVDFVPLHNGLGLEVELVTPHDLDPWDATNYLGGIGDVLEVKTRRGPLDHLGGLEDVALYENDRQIKEVHYRHLLGDVTRYRVRLWELE